MVNGRSIWLSLVFLGMGNCLSAQTSPDIKVGLVTLGTDTIQCPEIQKGDTVEAVFYFKNVGKDPVKIYQVHPGCQCTAPIYHDTVRAGQTDSVILVFYSKNNHEEYFIKDAIVLNSVQERSYYVVGHMVTPKEGEGRPARKIRLTNKPGIKSVSGKNKPLKSK
jgi:hypothetical protein